MTRSTKPYHLDDIVIWPDGSWTTVEDIQRGEFSHKSDDYEIVRLEDHDRLRALGLAEDLDIL